MGQILRYTDGGETWSQYPPRHPDTGPLLAAKLRACIERFESGV